MMHPNNGKMATSRSGERSRKVRHANNTIFCVNVTSKVPGDSFNYAFEGKLGTIDAKEILSKLSPDVRFVGGSEKESAQIRNIFIDEIKRRFAAEHDLGPEAEWDDTMRTLFAIQYPEVL